MLSLVTDATVEPVTLAEMKTFMKVDLTDEEDVITSLIASARKKLETWAGIGMTSKTFDYYLDEFADVIEIPLPPLQSVDAFVYNDSSYDETAVTSTLYTTFTYSGITRGEIIKKDTGAYPTSTAPKNKVRIRFTNGFGALASDVPDDLKTAIKLTVAHWFENRESQAIPPEALAIMRNYKVYNV